MRGTLIVSIIIVAAVIFLWQGGETSSTGTTALLQEIMEASGSAPEGGEALYWGSVGKEFLDFAELESLAEEIANALGIEPEGPRERLKEEGFNLVDIPGRLPSGISGRVILQSIDSAAAGSSPLSGGTFLLIQLIEEGCAWKALEAGERLPLLLRPFSQGELTLDITAYLPGRLSQAEMSHKARGLLQAAGAKVVEEMESEGLVSLTGYTPLVGHYLNLGNEIININVALRYDSHREMTLLRLGVPLIGGGY